LVAVSLGGCHAALTSTKLIGQQAARSPK